ncbi:MAG: amino acid permease [Polyangiaceae bacterium]|nr:amino acid permease [Polyangiaceae bacterium]
MSLFLKKDLAKVVAEANDPNVAERPAGELKRSLTAFHLTMLGIGAVIGAGIFSLTGTAAAHHAGPAIAYSFMIGGILCALAGLCYAELASMIPVAGSAYAYAYTTMGEVIAWIIGWDLILEYAFGAVVVSIAWSAYLVQFIESINALFPSVNLLPDGALIFTKGPWETVKLSTGQVVHGVWNIPATIVAAGAASVLYRGITESVWVNNLIVVVKVVIVSVFVILGIGLVTGDNLIVNPEAFGPGKLVPEAIVDAKGVSHFGWGLGGVLTGAGVVFFAYIGFDAVSTTAQEAKNPQRDLPIGILASLAICTVLYILVAITLTGVVHYTQLGVAAPIGLGIDKIVELRGWGDTARATFTATVKFGALAGLSSVILVMMLGQTRVFYAMSGDGLLPWFSKTHVRHKTPHIATAITGVFVAIAGGCLPMHLVGELVSIGTLLAFVLVCLGVPLLRRSNPDQPRPFKLRYPWAIGISGALACTWVMWGLPKDTWLRLILWLLLGYAIYASFGIHHSRVRQGEPLSPGWYVGQLAVVITGLLLTFPPGAFVSSSAYALTAAVAAVAFGVSALVNGRRLMRSRAEWPHAQAVWMALVVVGSASVVRGVVGALALG